MSEILIADGELEHSSKLVANQNTTCPNTANDMEASSRSLLLELPTELRLQIYAAVIEEDLVHVEADWKDPNGNMDIKAFAYECKPHLRLELCEWSYRNRDPEIEMYEYCMDPMSEGFKANREPKPSTSDLKIAWPHSMFFHIRHANCFDRKCLENLRPQDQENQISTAHQGLDLRFLRTCKSVYTDARLLFYQMKTFSFNSSYIWDAFMLSRSKDQLANVRSLHFNISSAQSLEEWNYALDADAMKSLPSLKKLFLWIDFVSGLNDRKNKKAYMEKFEAEVYYKRPICFFRMCPLKEVKIFLNPGRLPCHGLEAGHYGWERMRQWSKEMEDRLLAKWEGPIDLLDA
ncbi:hypothetical protein TWF694_011228 [Orbilia ellipsospora]|uniref:F-box domain-containing protein n=1 Tax=Orbilia ellipsospora TaxID=2528407 RepID=A0AAV9XB22_9PEZI